LFFFERHPRGAIPALSPHGAIRPAALQTGKDDR